MQGLCKACFHVSRPVCSSARELDDTFVVDFSTPPRTPSSTSFRELGLEVSNVLKHQVVSHTSMELPLRTRSATYVVAQVVAGTFNVVKAGRFYGRYWGAFETVKNLHFEACCESCHAVDCDQLYSCLLLFQYTAVNNAIRFTKLYFLHKQHLRDGCSFTLCVPD